MRRGRGWIAAALILLASPAVAQPRPPAGAVALTLPEAVFLGLRNNRGIRGEYLQRIADRFALRVAEDSFTPRLTLAAEATRQRNAGVNSTQLALGPVVSVDTPTGARFIMSWLATQTNVRGQPGQAPSEIGFQVEQPLLAGGGVDYALAPRRIARISEQGAQLRLKAQVIDQISQIILAYRALLQAQEQTRIAEDSLRRARDLVEVNRALIAAGRLAEVELIQSEASIAQQELQLIGARNNGEAARLSLLVLMGVDPASRIWASERPSAPAVRIDMDRALATAYAKQPAYLSRLLTIEINRINLDIARNQRLWDVSIVAGAGQQALRSQVLETIGALSTVRSDFNIGLRVNIPIGGLSREQQEVNATVALRQSEVQVEEARDQLRQQAENAVRGIEAQRRQAQLARRARELTAQQLAAELVKLQAGRSSNFQVVSFQTALQQAESTELAAVIAYLNALTAMDQVLGTTLETWRISLNER
ncbi:TolC family protein [Falsiroseomonas tokyonensis]|uniref:TolC family protein n=1 Tax=Falsiroseomonas tokyonensis TaxID=430521 RepID=A0ABV7C359_9PROT|nr:TolC family protein [Falsiroseomonas tokyonensis]MBU8541090.1 TolC family protein [Falsiroseomonas tokyonensis]